MPAEAAFDYLADPRNRPSWQSSLRRVELLDDDIGLGQRWVDVTAPGLRPVMRTTGYDRPVRWAEAGRWRGVTAELALTFAPTAGGCAVTAEVRVVATGALRPLAPAIAAAARRVIPGDLRRAAAALGSQL